MIMLDDCCSDKTSKKPTGSISLTLGESFSKVRTALILLWFLDAMGELN